jgi:hypothetical protein
VEAGFEEEHAPVTTSQAKPAQRRMLFTGSLIYQLNPQGADNARVKAGLAKAERVRSSISGGQREKEEDLPGESSI